MYLYLRYWWIKLLLLLLLLSLIFIFAVSNINLIISWKTCLLLFLKKRLKCNFFPLNIDWLTDTKKIRYFLLLLKLFFATALLTSQHRCYINRPRMQVTKYLFIIWQLNLFNFGPMGLFLSEAVECTGPQACLSLSSIICWIRSDPSIWKPVFPNFERSADQHRHLIL